MGTYYYLANYSKKEIVHLDNHVKAGAIQNNKAVHTALINYIFENRNDTFKLISDSSDECYEFREVNLLNYKFKQSETMKEIVADLNLIYANSRYRVKNGVGYDNLKHASDRLWTRVIFRFAKWLVDLGYRLAYYGGR